MLGADAGIGMCAGMANASGRGSSDGLLVSAIGAIRLLASCSRWSGWRRGGGPTGCLATAACASP